MSLESPSMTSNLIVIQTCGTSVMVCRIFTYALSNYFRFHSLILIRRSRSSETASLITSSNSKLNVLQLGERNRRYISNRFNLQSSPSMSHTLVHLICYPSQRQNILTFKMFSKHCECLNNIRSSNRKDEPMHAYIGH